ncbi:uncharacterized protein LOC142227092 [Haematobia irritans]|uniref:uncharacterized protein LOC142227092 n=1 Tax=Haematobia irritans TaxID=7368 RepID=UPI003F4F90E2
MLCPPTMRPASPAESEISVGGAPSPLPPAHNRSAIDLIHHQQQLIMHQHAVAAAAAGLTRAAVGAMPEEYFQPLKRLRMSAEGDAKERSPSPVQESNHSTTVATSTKSQLEGVKSFSIADILGHEKQRDSSPSPPPPASNKHHHTTPSSGLLQPRTEPLDIVPHPAAAAAMLLPGSAHVVRPWDHLLAPMPGVRPFIPSALLHYEQRLALDYHRQLQEHFNAQAQLLRHMNGMDIIPSESGSERSSSAASDCCSPEIANRSSTEAHHPRHSPQGSLERSQQNRAAGSGSGNGSNNATGNGGVGGSGSGSASGSGKVKNDTPLDALFQMTTKDFDESDEKSHIDLFSNRPQPKKKRKSRTAFTNHQIFELEKRFLYQKYLSPADRDEIASSLGLSNAQVITWFQNRRAKQKRDIEELKKDFESVKVFSGQKSFLENVNDLSILKKKPLHPDAVVMEGLAAAAAAGMMPGISGHPSHPHPSTAIQALSPPK